MSFIGLSHVERRVSIDLYAWDEAHKARFEERLEKKILRTARKFDFLRPEQVTKVLDAAKKKHERVKTELQRYFKAHIKGIADALQLTPVTEEGDHILFIPTKSRDNFFVYFGAMTKSMVHIACWMVVPTEALGEAADAGAHKPRICFWMLNTSYAQQMAALENDGEEKNIDKLEQVLDLSEGLEYH